ncbi:MAG: NrsF family protein [Woeseiaceae bacterium]
MKRQDLIDDLANDLRPVRRPGKVGRAALLCLLVATLWSVVIVLATGPLRPGALRDLAAHPLFIAETVLAALAIVALGVAVMRSAIPGEPRMSLRLLWLLPVAAWVAVYVAELANSPAWVSNLGGRYECHWQVALFSLPAFALFLWSARRLFPLRPRSTGFLAGAAAAAIPAALMQFACMYVPEHILVHHIAPVGLVAVLGALIGPYVLRPPAEARRPRETAVH